MIDTLKIEDRNGMNKKPLTSTSKKDQKDSPSNHIGNISIGDNASIKNITINNKGRIDE